MSLDTYCKQFTQLKRAPSNSFPDATNKKAPHKPLLLLAIMELIGQGQITHHFIRIDEELTDLNLLFTQYWRCLMPPAKTSSVAFPFSRLNSEPFWELVAIAEQEITKAEINSISSVSQLRKFSLGANLDEELFFHLNNPVSRAKLADTLLNSCFSEEGRKAITQELTIQHQAFKYSKQLTSKNLEIKDAIPDTEYGKIIRNQGFRRAIVNCYDHRCAICGIRIVTSEGHTVIEAAHIKPWSDFKDDDVKNGMALCRLCHWSFDEGLMSVDEKYRVLVSRKMTTATNAPGFLMAMEGRGIIAPEEEVYKPDPKRLRWHRNNIFESPLSG